MKKFCSIMIGLAMIGIISFGLNSSVETLQSAHGDYPAPAKPGYFNINIGDGGSPEYTHGHTGIVGEDGHADLPAPQEN